MAKLNKAQIEEIADKYGYMDCGMTIIVDAGCTNKEVRENRDKLLKELKNGEVEVGSVEYIPGDYQGDDCYAVELN